MNCKLRLRNLICVFCLLLLVFPSARAFAQDGKILGGLLRELIQSELQRRQESAFPLGQQPLPIARPGQSQPQPSREFSQQLRGVRGHANSFVSESAGLLRAMEAESRRHAGLHNHLDEVRKLNALATYVQQNLGQSPQRSYVVNELGQLDAQWRMAKYHLQQVPQLPGSCNNYIERLDGLRQKMCDPFDITPQFDRRELVRLIEALAAEIHHLQRDVQYEARSNPRARQLTFKLQGIETRIRLLSDAAYGRERYDEIVAEYNAMSDQLSPISQAIFQLNDVRIDRTFEQIRQLDQAIREQLWLPQQLDIAHISHIADMGAAQINSAMSLVTLPMLLEAQNSEALLREAKLLDRAMVQMCECAVVGATSQDLVLRWQELDNAWGRLDRLASTFQSPEFQNARQLVQMHLSDLRVALGIELVFDRPQIQRYGSEIDGIADQLVFHVTQWQRRPNSNLTNATVRLTNDFARSCREFHRQCGLQDVPQQDLRKSCNNLINAWSPLRTELAKCDSPDLQSILRVADKSTNCLLHLQTLVR